MRPGTALVSTSEDSASSRSAQGSGSSENGTTESERGSGTGSSDLGTGSGSDNGVGSSSGSDNGETTEQEVKEGNHHHHEADSSKRGGVGENRKKLRRVMANRRSARESRERRKKLLVDLEDSVAKLSNENSELAKSNLQMRQDLVNLLQQAGLPPVLPDSLISNLALQSIVSGQGVSIAAPDASADQENPFKRRRQE